MDYQIDLWCHLLLTCSILYAIFLYFIYLGWQKGSAKSTTASTNTKFPFISVLVPARNEAATIIACVKAILAQDYPSKFMEVIVVDDHSEDATVEHLKHIKDQRLRVLSLATYSPDSAGKKAALQLGINESKGSCILTTDADCIAPTAWLSSFATAWQSEQEMVLAPVRISAQAGLLNAFQGLDVAGTLLLTGASAYWKRPILSNGANFGFTKTVFQELNGYTGNENRASGDDVFLLQKATKAHRHIAFLYTSAALVDTAATKNWQSLFWQRLRWAGKVDAYQDFYLLSFQAGVFLYCALLCILPFFLISGNGECLLLGWAIKILADFFFLRYACRQIGENVWMRWFLPAQLLHTGYVFMLGCLALLPLKFYWKGRLLR
jgi:cellulose synthase/poly-beta-1,6-N-acetylglucosamine synthase-like glycosyltransferase